MCVLAPGLFVIIIDSRVKIIDNESPGASPCDPRGRLHANNTKSIVLYNIRLHIPRSYFTFSLGFFHFLWLAVASDKAYQLLAHGRWFSPASSTTKTGRHDIVEILLKVALSTKNQINQSFFISCGRSK
jgi:hypothetical protein